MENKLSTEMFSFCQNPTNPSSETWADNIDVMPQATAGQEIRTLIGPLYCFRAPVTAQKVEAFYTAQMPPPNWVPRHVGSGQIMFYGFTPQGMRFVQVVYGPGNKNDLIVELAVSNPLGGTPPPGSAG